MEINSEDFTGRKSEVRLMKSKAFQAIYFPQLKLFFRDHSKIYNIQSISKLFNMDHFPIYNYSCLNI